MKNYIRHHSNPNLSIFLTSIIVGVFLPATTGGTEPISLYAQPTAVDNEDGDGGEFDAAAGLSEEKSLQTSQIAIGDWLTFSANFDMSYRKTQFYHDEEKTYLLQGDSRMELWFPPGRDTFSWGPYLRMTRVESNRDHDFENNWGARPGFGFQMYPLSALEPPKTCSKLARLLSPVHLFVERNHVHYRGEQYDSYPDEQTRGRSRLLEGGQPRRHKQTLVGRILVRGDVP